MNLMKSSSRVKLFALLTLLATLSTVVMLYLGFRVNALKTKLKKTSAITATTVKFANEIAQYKGEIAAQKQLRGEGNIELSPAEIEKNCSANNIILKSCSAIEPPRDRKDYLEKGYNVVLNQASKNDIGRLLADLETNIPGCKISRLSLTSIKDRADTWNANFEIVKSVSKL